MVKTPRCGEDGIELLADAERSVRPADPGGYLIKVSCRGQPPELGPARPPGDPVGVHVTGNQHQVRAGPSRRVIENRGKLRMLVRDAEDVKMDGIQPDAPCPQTQVGHDRIAPLAWEASHDPA